MEEEVKGIGDYLDIIKRHKYLVIIPALILIAISAAVAYMLPATYKSEGLILIEAQEIPHDLVKSTVTSYADQRIEIIKQRIMTTANVMEIVNKYSLYPEMRKNSPASVLVTTFRENMAVEMVEANVTDPRSGRAKRASIAFNVSFMDKSPQLAQKVASELVTKFLTENVRTRTERAADTQSFLEKEATKFQRKIQLLEKKIAEFKDEYSDSLPELLQYNLSTVERLQDELAANQNQIIVLTDQIMTMTLEQSNLQTYLATSQTSADGQQASSSEMELTQARADFSRLKAKYSANHPDVMQMKRQINSLELELGIESPNSDMAEQELEQARTALKELKQRYSISHPDVKVAMTNIKLLQEKVASQATSSAKAEQTNKSVTKKQLNPIYLQLSSKVDSSEREILRLRNRQGEVRNKLAAFEQRVVKTHQVERAHDDLIRDHDNHLAKYKELRAKQLEAELAQNLESENKGESFTLIEPPLVPSKAEKPNRPKILAMGVVVSIGTGLGLALLVEMMFGGVRGYTQITRVVGHAPLVVLPMITTEQDIQNKKKSRNRILFSIFVLILISIAGFHFFVMNLEILWFKVLRKVSLL
ncbi:sugar transporter [Methylophaga sp. 41_12_T18]|nr:sugar transporter [Methylophaga sp. 41_12_T18]